MKQTLIFIIVIVVVLFSFGQQLTPCECEWNTVNITPTRIFNMSNTIYEPADTSVFKSNVFKYLEPDGQGNMWAASSGYGVSVFDGCKWSTAVNEFQSSGGNNGFIVRAMRRNPIDNTIWVGMSRTQPCLGYLGKIYVYQNKDIISKTYSPPTPQLVTDVDEFSTCDKLNNILIRLGFPDMGPDKCTYANFLSIINAQLSSRMLRCMDFNKLTGECWVGCTPQLCEPQYNGGLSVLRNGATHFNRLQMGMPSDENRDLMVYAMTSDKNDGSVYAFVRRSCPLNGGSCVNPFIIKFDKDGSYFIKYDESNAFDLDDDTTIQLPLNPNKEIRAMLIDSKGRLWVGGNLNGITVRTKSKKDGAGTIVEGDFWTFLQSGVQIPYLGGAIVNFDAITEGPDGSIYFGTTLGLLRFNGSDNFNLPCNWESVRLKGLTNQSVNAIKFDHENYIWLATNEGIFTTSSATFACTNIRILDKKDITCYEKENGIVKVSGEYGIPPYSYTLKANGKRPAITNTSGEFNKLCFGFHTIMVKDSKQKEDSITFFIEGPETPLSITKSKVTNALGCGFGNIEIAAMGGTPPYRGDGVLIKEPGAYSLIVSDANQCSTSIEVTIGIDELEAIASIDCKPDGGATINISAVGGVPNYSGDIGDHSISANGNYTFTVSDGHGCTASTTVNVLCCPTPQFIAPLPGDITLDCQEMANMISNGNTHSLGYTNSRTDNCKIEGSVNSTIVGSGDTYIEQWFFMDINEQGEGVPDPNAYFIEHTRVITVNSTVACPPAIDANYGNQQNGPDPESKKVVVDKSGNAYVIGEYILTATLNSKSLTSLGENDVFIAKYDSDGKLLWVNTIGSTADDRASNIAIDDAGNNIYVTGTCKGISLLFASSNSSVISRTSIGSGDFFVAKIDALTGNFLAANMSGANSSGSVSNKNSKGLGVAADGTVYVCGGISACGNGSYGGNIIPDKNSCGSPHVAFLAKYDSNCNLIDAVIPESNANTCVDEMMTGLYIQPTSALQDAGKVFVTGFVSGQINIGGSIIGENDKQNAYYAVYNPSFTGGNPSPVKLNWISGGSGKSTGILATDSGFVYITHNINDGGLTSCNSFTKSGLEDAYLSKFNKTGSGACLWNTRLATPGTDRFESMTLGKKDSIYVAGYTNGASAILSGNIGILNRGVHDGFLAQYDGSGNPHAVWNIGGKGEDFVYGITTDQFGGIYLVGSLKNSVIHFNSFTLNSTNDETNGYVVSLRKLDPINITSISPLSICKGEEVEINFTSAECNPGNIFTAQLSDADGNFNTPINLGSLNAISSGSIHATISNSIQEGTSYRIRIISSDPPNRSNSNQNISITEPPAYYSDLDSDSYGGMLLGHFCSAPAGAILTGGDCDDSNSLVNPGMPEVCNGLDDDCDVLIDDADTIVNGGTIWFADSDSDSFGDFYNRKRACTIPSGYVANSDDCNDSNPSIHPGAPETCNNLDDDCDGTIDEGVTLTFFRDDDGDGFGTSTGSVQACVQPLGYVSNSTDCNDNNASVYPNAPESCDGLDNDCNGQIDENVKTRFYRDVDGDGYGNPTRSLLACIAPTGYVTDNSDCNDGRKLSYPGAAELCNGMDDNCNGLIDENAKSLFYRDADGDGFGNSNSTNLSCDAPAGYVATNTDCNDELASVYPGADELCNDIDDDCDGQIDEGCPVVYKFYIDMDTDGFGNPFSYITSNEQTPPPGYVLNNTDCDDNNVNIHPQAFEICNDIDDNCSGDTDEGLSPLHPSAITGHFLNVCKNSTKIYSVTNQVGVVFNWTAPANASIISGQGTNTVTVSFSNSFVSGTLSVTATKCTTSGTRKLTIYSLPAAPSQIDGLNSVCINSIHNYSCSIIPDAISYNWIAPSGSSIISGQGSSDVIVQFGGSASTGNISVQAVNACGTSVIHSYPVSVVNCNNSESQNRSDTGINQFPDKELNVLVYPNPTNNNFNIIVINNNLEKIQISVFDILGKRVLNEIKTSGEGIQIGAELRPGTYFVEIIQSGLSKTIKLIKL